MPVVAALIDRKRRDCVSLKSGGVDAVRTHGKLRMSPAMAAGIATTFLSFEDVLARVDATQGPQGSWALQEAGGVAP